MYSVPHDDKDDVKEEGDIKVMASHAIIREDGLLKAPGCVVGFQFLQKNMTNRFLDITGTSKNVRIACDTVYHLVLFFFSHSILKFYDHL